MHIGIIAGRSEQSFLKLKRGLAPGPGLTVRLVIYGQMVYHLRVSGTEDFSIVKMPRRRGVS